MCAKVRSRSRTRPGREESDFGIYGTESVGRSAGRSLARSLGRCRCRVIVETIMNVFKHSHSLAAWRLPLTAQSLLPQSRQSFKIFAVAAEASEASGATAVCCEPFSQRRRPFSGTNDADLPDNDDDNVGIRRSGTHEWL